MNRSASAPPAPLEMAIAALRESSLMQVRPAKSKSLTSSEALLRLCAMLPAPLDAVCSRLLLNQPLSSLLEGHSRVSERRLICR